MSLKIYNTLSRRKEEFVPLKEGHVGIYACGITAYDVCHIGHARSAVVFDVIVRYLKYRGFAVTFVKNFTDVDDKIIERARREKTGIQEIADRYIRDHDAQMDRLGVERPTHTPRATEHIPGMIRLVEALIAKGLAYELDGDVYYAVERFPSYGSLSGRNLAEMTAGVRIDVDERKRHPFDFALWKASREGEPAWESPWGPGRPGWHLECSVMSQHFLGETFDIHGGGEDLIFPHHENEIAQAQGVTGKPLARYWIHNGFVRVNSEKMSKSLGNFYTIAEILAEYHPEVLRFFLVQSHYRSPVDFSDAALEEARQGLGRLYGCLLAVEERLAEGGPGGAATPLADHLEGLKERFCEAMDDDFNTARALGLIFETVRHINAALADKKARPSPEILARAGALLRELAGVLGLLREAPAAYVDGERRRQAAKKGLSVAEIEALIAERRQARQERLWQKADEIRDRLAGLGVVLKDGPQGTTWSIG